MKLSVILLAYLLAILENGAQTLLIVLKKRLHFHYKPEGGSTVLHVNPFFWHKDTPLKLNETWILMKSVSRGLESVKQVYLHHWISQLEVSNICLTLFLLSCMQICLMLSVCVCVIAFPVGRISVYIQSHLHAYSIYIPPYPSYPSHSTGKWSSLERPSANTIQGTVTFPI